MNKNRNFKITSYIVISLLSFAILIPSFSAKADVGPKPSMYFDFQFPDDSIHIVEGNLVTCKDKNCDVYKNYNGYFDCESNSCYASPFYYPDAPQNYEYYKLVITFSDSIRESNTFEDKHFNSYYEVSFNQFNLLVKEKITFRTVFNGWGIIFFYIAAVVTIPLETIISFFYFQKTKTKKWLLFVVVVANLISLVILWFGLPILFNGIFTLLFCEVFVVLFEAFFLYIIGLGIRFSMKNAITLSLIMNLFSFLFGLFIVTLNM